MEEIAISKFKATCLSVLETVRRTGRPVRVTRFGKPMAEIVPSTSDQRAVSWLGSLEGTVQIKGDIVKPAAELHEWKALKD